LEEGIKISSNEVPGFKLGQLSLPMDLLPPVTLPIVNLGGFPAQIVLSPFHGSHSFPGQSSDFQWAVSKMKPLTTLIQISIIQKYINEIMN
jgi:hypothetical protein